MQNLAVSIRTPEHKLTSERLLQIHQHFGGEGAVICTVRISETDSLVE